MTPQIQWLEFIIAAYFFMLQMLLVYQMSRLCIIIVDMVTTWIHTMVKHISSGFWGGFLKQKHCHLATFDQDKLHSRQSRLPVKANLKQVAWKRRQPKRCICRTSRLPVWMH